MFDTQEKLEQFFEAYGIKGEWIHPNVYGFSRIFKFEVLGQTYFIEWYCNYSTLIMADKNAHFWFNRIEDGSSYPVRGKWLEFKFGIVGRGVHVKIKED